LRTPKGLRNETTPNVEAIAAGRPFFHANAWQSIKRSDQIAGCCQLQNIGLISLDAGSAQTALLQAKRIGRNAGTICAGEGIADNGLRL